MIRNLQGHDAEEHRAGLAEDQPRASSRRMLQGQKDLLTVGRLILSELAPRGRRAARRLLHHRRTREDGARSSSCSPATPISERKDVGNQLRARRGAGRPVRAREAEDPAHATCPPTTSRSPRASARRRRATSSCCRCCSRGGQGGDRARVVRALQPDPPGLPRPAHREHRHRAQHDRGEHAHRGAAQAVAVARRASCRASRRSCRQTNAGAARRRRGCSPSRTPRSSARTSEVEQARAGARGEGRAARAHLQVQVRVPREHVARAAHAAQQPAHPRRTSCRRTPTAT